MKKIKSTTMLYISMYMLLLTIFTSCSKDAGDPKKCLDSVKRIFPNSTIYNRPGNHCKRFEQEVDGRFYCCECGEVEHTVL